MSDRRAWEAAYRATYYVARLARGELVQRIDHADPTADERLRREVGCVNGWAFVTPCNPRSVEQTIDENARRCEAMRRELEARGQRFVAAVHRDPEGHWPEEESFLLIDPEEGLAESLGRAYEQNAVVLGALGGAPVLRWIEPG